MREAARVTASRGTATVIFLVGAVSFIPGPVFLSGERLALRAVTPGDYEFIARHWNTPSNRRMTSRHDPQTAADVQAMVEESDAEFVAFLPTVGEESVGFAWAFRVSDVNGQGELGYWIVEEERGKGYATETVDLVAEWAFEDRQLHRLQARVFAGNDGSERVLEKVGFGREGRLREAYRVEGEYVDATIFGLLADEWPIQ